MTDRHLTNPHAALGYKRLSPLWAKLELLGGLTAAGLGLFMGQWSLSRPDAEWGLAAAGLALFVLGGYLALAGHRSHLYRSLNEGTAYLAGLVAPSQDKGRPE
jgi:hypothetical protein